VNDTEENAESQAPTDNIAVLAKPSPESKVYVQWDKSDVGKEGLITTDNKDHTRCMSRSVFLDGGGDPRPILPSPADDWTTSFYFATSLCFPEDNEEEVLGGCSHRRRSGYVL
jgi:hypothetical protein